MQYTEYPAATAAQFFGRTYRQGERVFFNWSGAGFAFRFTGTAAAARLYGGDPVPRPEERAYIGVFVDDCPINCARFALDGPERVYTLVQGLPYGVHTVRVVKQTEMYYGTAAVSTILADGAPEPAPARGKCIEFLGDSITCGYGDLCSRESAEFITGEESFSLTYAALTCERLHADPCCVAASGNGIYHDYGMNTVNLIPQLYPCTDRIHQGNVPWAFAAHPVDAVVIKLGQNDGQYCGGADLPEEQRTAAVLHERRQGFQAAAVAFLTAVRAARPGVPIIYLVETEMLLKDEILAAIAVVGGITPLLIEPKRPHEGVGANGHWSTATHARVSLLLSHQLAVYGL